MRLDRLDQLWVTDVAAVRISSRDPGRVFAAGSRLGAGRQLEVELTLAALRVVLEQRKPRPGLVHHSDRGVQYACRDYIELLSEHGVAISMSRKGNPYDNATAESFMKTLKYEEVYRGEYRDVGEARDSIEQFVEQIYNPEAAALRSELSSAGGVRTVPGGEGGQDGLVFGGVQSMSFFRHEKIYRPILRNQSRSGPAKTAPAGAHRYDEFPAGCSLAGCSPAEPASASPAAAHREARRSGCTIEKQRTGGSVLTVCLTPGDNPSAAGFALAFVLSFPLCDTRPFADLCGSQLYLCGN